MNIPEQIRLFENQAISRKKLLFSFLEKFDIGNGRSINDYITDKVLLIENIEASDNYTYWMDGGLSWFYWYKENLQEANEKELISMMICNLKFHYVFNQIIPWQEKTKKMCVIVEDLQKLLSSLGIETEIELTNFTHQTSAIPDFDFFYSGAKQKEPFYNIKLILKSDKKGGSRSPSRRRLTKDEMYSMRKRKESEIKERQVEDFKKLAEPFLREKLPELNDKILVEFHLEYFDPYYVSKEVNVFDISKFKKSYIDEFKYLTKYDSFIDPIFARKFLNKLNLYGLITFSYLNNSKKESESGLNIERLRQNYLLQKLNKFDISTPLRTINKVFGDIKKLYIRLFEKFKCFNGFFIEKIDNLLLENNLVQYQSFIDFIDKYYMLLFRPAINAFIVDINKELFEKHNVKLFIAGGDAMRRYNYDISFTSDIDCKLHIKNATGDNVKNQISEIVMRHVIKLRNYLEERKTLVLSDIISKRNRGLEVFEYMIDNQGIKIDVLLDDTMKNKYQQFRVRDNKKNDAMPVDLYSLDFRYKISHYDISNPQQPKLMNHFNHLISILDVVIIDEKDFHLNDLVEDNGVAFASKEFLLKDFETTYTTEDMALGRISNDKARKDIQRYNQMSLDNPDTYTPRMNGLIVSIGSLNLSTVTKERFQFIIQKIINRNMINIRDYFVIRNLTSNDLKPIGRYPLLIEYLNTIKEMKTNLPFENLNRIDGFYHSYNYFTSNKDIIKFYLDIFMRISGAENDGLYKHAAPFNNEELRKLMNVVEFKTPTVKLLPYDEMRKIKK